jgi:hypothetical protein
VAGPPRAGGRIDRHGERLVPLGLRVVVREIVDELLDPHGVPRRPPAGREEAADVGVGGRVDVDRERRERLFADGAEPVFGEAVVALGVGDAPAFAGPPLPEVTLAGLAGLLALLALLASPTAIAAAGTTGHRHSKFVECFCFRKLFEFDREDIACGLTRWHPARTAWLQRSAGTSLAIPHERHLPATRLPGGLHGRKKKSCRHQGHRRAGAERQDPLSEAAGTPETRRVGRRYGPTPHGGGEHGLPQVG